MQTDGDNNESQLDDLVAQYIDRLNQGQRVIPEEVLLDHPGIGQEILDQLEAFVGLSVTSETRPPLGNLGDYTLRRQIGRGGMGVVYEAWENSMDRVVALKVLPPGLAADNKAFHRFMREAKTAGQLSHQNVVPVYSTGVKEGTPWYAMEYVEGETLAQIVARIKDSAPESATPFGKKEDTRYFGNLADGFGDVANGLQHAHSKGVIHRDIKPSNLILESENRLRILDFGLARLEGQESLTVSGDFVGTPLYMSPEQARRRKVRVDHRTDVYSLGATMYEMLTAQPPFKGKNYQDTLSQIIERDPVEPRKVNPRVPKDLETIVLKCLRKDPGERYGTAEALAQDLKRFARGDPIEARPPSSWDRLARRLRRQRTKLLVAAAFLVLLTSAGWFAYQSVQAERQAEEADRKANLAAFRPAVLEVLSRMQAEHLSIKALSRDLPGLPWWFIGSAITPDELRTLFAARARLRLQEVVVRLAAIAKGLPEGAEAKKSNAHYLLARAYLLLEELDQAEEEVDKALRCDPGFVPARVLSMEIRNRNSRGGHFARGEQLARIESEYEESEGWERSWLLAYRSFSTKKWVEMIAAYDELIALSRREEPFVGCLLESYMRRGIANLVIRNLPAAQSDLSIVQFRAPSLETALLLATSHFLDEGRGHRERAEAIVRELYRGAGREEKNEAALWIAAVCTSVSEYDSALEWVNKLEGFAPRDRIEAYFLWRAERTKEAIVAGRRATARDRRDPGAHLILASALLSDLLARPEPKDGRLSELAGAAREASRLDPESALARGLLEAGRGLKRQREQERMSTVNQLKRTIWVPVGLSLLAGTGLGQEGLLGGFFGDEKPLPDHLNQGFVCDPSVTEDGLELYFARHDGSSWQYCVSRRALTEQEWGKVENLTEIGTSARGLFVMPDGMTLYVSSWEGIYKLTREERGAPYPAARVRFGAPQPLTGISTGAGEMYPSLTRDGRELYFQATRGEVLDIYVAWRSQEEADANEPFKHEQTKRLEISSHYKDVQPSISADGSTLFWSDLGDWFGDPSRPGCQPLGNIWYATRTERWVKDAQGEEFPAPFGPAQCLGLPIDGPVNDANPGVSWDWPHSRSKLYFCRYGPGRSQLSKIWEATWYPVSIEAPFLRCDCNDDGNIDLSDAVCILGWLFQGETEPGCLAATDTNGDARADLSDAVHLLAHLFSGGPAPVEPFPDCGPGLPADDEMGCKVPPEICQ